MTFKLEIETDNAAFEEDPAPELRRLLFVVAEHVHAGRKDGKVQDVNGNTVGAWSIEEPVEEDCPGCPACAPGGIDHG